MLTGADASSSAEGIYCAPSFLFIADASRFGAEVVLKKTLGLEIGGLVVVSLIMVDGAGIVCE